MPKDKPNILVIWGDDIGITNLSCYSDGLMGYRTEHRSPRRRGDALHRCVRRAELHGRTRVVHHRPERVPHWAQQGRGAGASVGLQAEDPTIAELLKNHGYATGQFGKNHLGDRNEYLPTVHGFDEFFGNLYHLNAEEDPRIPDYPSNFGFSGFKERMAPRRAPLPRDQEGRQDGASPLGAGRQADDRGHRSVDAQADGDL